MGTFLISILLVTTLTFLLILVWFKKRQPEKNHYRNLSLWVSTIVAAPFVYAGILFVWFKISSNYTERIFDKIEWRENKEKRFEIVNDLIAQKKLIGMTKNGVIEILGVATSENDSTLIYYIGYSPKKFLNSIPGWLEVEFKDEKASTLRVLP